MGANRATMEQAMETGTRDGNHITTKGRMTVERPHRAKGER